MKAKTRKQKKYGVLVGANEFDFKHGGPHKMTMTPGGVPITVPILYQGYNGNKKIDQGIAQPGSDFYVKGNKVIETPLYQIGGDIYESQLPPVTITASGNKSKYINTLPNQIQSNTSPTIDPSIANMRSPYLLPTKSFSPQKKGALYSDMSIRIPRQYDSKYYDPSNSSSGNKPWWSFAGNTKGDALANVSMYGPAAYNIIRGLSKVQKYPKHFNEEAPESLRILRGLKYRPDYEQEIMAQNKLYEDARNNMTSTSSRIATLMQGKANLDKHMREEDRNAQGINNQYAGQYANALNNYGLNKQAERVRNQMLDIHAKSARDNILNTGLTQLQAAGMKTAEYMNRNKETGDTYTLLGDQYKNYGVIPYDQLKSSGYNMDNAVQFKNPQLDALNQQYQDLQKELETLRQSIGTKRFGGHLK